MISNCGHDENGKYTGGKAGDQTGDEWAVIKWYSRPWNVVLRYPDINAGKAIAALARAAAENDKIGYCQGHRGTFWAQLQKAGYDPAKITTACEADCSSGVAAIVKAAGHKKGLTSLQNVPATAYTGNLKAVLKKAGFEALTDSKYLQSDKYLLPGDVLLYEGHHTAINLDRGPCAVVQTKVVTTGSNGVATAKSFDRAIAGTYTTKAALNVRTNAGTGAAILGVLQKGVKIKCYGYYNTVNGVKWYLIQSGSLTGYCSSAYLEKVI